MLLEAYEARVAAGELTEDEAQRGVVEKLDGLSLSLNRNNGSLMDRFLKRGNGAPRGLYIYGAVGRGKTMLMDMFFAGVEDVAKRRVHFHGFMQDVHAKLHSERKNARDAIAPVAASLANEARLLCLDEMQISDIADAMIVGRLFEALFAKGVVLVTTSNLPPDDLYKDGLNRQLFLPFIKLLAERLEVISLDGITDYRLGRVKAHETFVTPLGPEADRKVQELWQRLTDEKESAALDIEVLGRKLHVPHAAHGCARFTFAELCGAALGPADYLALARNFRTLFLEHIPALHASNRNEAKRFVTLIDTLHDAQVRLVASSARPPEGIYPAGDHRFEFQRTVSRLKEMQSASWWGKRIAET